jgi:hypothetical protein
MYPSDLASEGKIRVTAVLEAVNYHTGHQGEWLGIMIGIIVRYRVFGWLVLIIKKNLMSELVLKDYFQLSTVYYASAVLSLFHLILHSFGFNALKCLARLLRFLRLDAKLNALIQRHLKLSFPLD